MRLIVGLGNPGGQYARHRHNIGFMAVDDIADAHGFSPWRSKFQALVSEGRLGPDKVLLMKPQTFMNRSGQAVGEAMRFFKLATEDVIVIHDELDLAPGKCRVKQGGGHAGHNGLRSIHAAIGPDYTRVRLGIGHPGHKDRVAGYVLHDFAKADAAWLEDLLRGIAEGAPALAAGDWGRFQNAVALRVKPPAKAPDGGSKAPDLKGKGAAAREKSEAKDGAKPARPVAQPPSAKPAAETEDTRSPLQKLMDRFR